MTLKDYVSTLPAGPIEDESVIQEVERALAFCWHELSGNDARRHGKFQTKRPNGEHLLESAAVAIRY
jgi:hypothetical protein